jgi:predicted site-specific integrase-resolvase
LSTNHTNPSIISQIEFAKKINLSRQRVNQFINEGRLAVTILSGRKFIILDEKAELIIKGHK